MPTPVLEAHLSLGLLLARQNKPTMPAPNWPGHQLDPGDAGPALKARAWRALAQIDRTTDTTEASNDLLEALKLSPETPDDTLLAANLADQAGEYDAAENAYRRVLATDPNSAAANAGLAHLLIARKQYPEAETLLRAALKQSPDDPALTAQLATVLAAQDKGRGAPALSKAPRRPSRRTQPSPACWLKSWPTPATMPAPITTTSPCSRHSQRP